MENYIRLYVKDSHELWHLPWFFTDMNKAANFVNDIKKKYGYDDFQIDFLTPEVITELKTSHQSVLSNRTNCTLEDFDAEHDVLSYGNLEILNKIDKELLENI